MHDGGGASWSECLASYGTVLEGTTPLSPPSLEGPGCGGPYSHLSACIAPFPPPPNPTPLPALPSLYINPTPAPVWLACLPQMTVASGTLAPSRHLRCCPRPGLAHIYLSSLPGLTLRRPGLGPRDNLDSPVQVTTVLDQGLVHPLLTCVWCLTSPPRPGLGFGR